MKTILIIFGTRPEAIKLCPLIQELKNRSNINVKVCVTGQHRQMLDQVLEIFKIYPDFDLLIMKDKQTLFDITINILTKLNELLEDICPDLVVVHGDTTTTFAAALAAFYKKIPIAHVEAGLRTNDIYNPYPEEFNRCAVSIIAKYNFAPTAASKNNLIKEGVDNDKIWVTGNTVIDAIKTTVDPDYENDELNWAQGSKLIFLTMHRRENIGVNMTHVFRAVCKLVKNNKDVKIIYPVHKNPLIRKIVSEELEGNDRIHLIEPVDVIACHNIMAHSYLIMTDSGGIQEEAPSFGVPVLVLRNATERPEGVAAGVLKLVGTDEDNVYKNADLLLNSIEAYEKMKLSSNPYGDGMASKRIADVLLNNLNY